jgi:hypothetical protein
MERNALEITKANLTCHVADTKFEPVINLKTAKTLGLEGSAADIVGQRFDAGTALVPWHDPVLNLCDCMSAAGGS